MGQFSWLDADTNEVILDNVDKPVYLLVPKEFGGGHLMTDCYDGYGRIGGDVYDYLAEWNRSWLAEHPEIVLYGTGKRIEDAYWYKDYAAGMSKKEIEAKFGSKESGCVSFEWRYIGIEIGCYDKDNFRLKYPLKISYDPNAVYETSEPSLGDPNQGWKRAGKTLRGKYGAYKKSLQKAIEETGITEIPKPRMRYPY